MEQYQKDYAWHEGSDGRYGLKSYWTSSQTVEFNNGQYLEDYKTELKGKIDNKGDALGYSLDEGEIYLYGNETLLDTEQMQIRVRPNIGLDDILNLSARLSNNQARFTWQDPEDVVFSELTLVEWAGTKVVRKAGSVPESVTDGTLIVNSTTRNQYSSSPYFDNTIRGNTYYYYRFFPYDTDGNYYGKTSCVLYYEQPLEEVLVPVISGTYTYSGSSQTSVWTNYDSTKMTMSGDNTGTNAGTYNVTFSLQEGYIWNDGTIEDKTLTWTIEPESLVVPSIQGTYVYTGSTITPTWDNYNSNKMSISGDTSGTNAGDYTVLFSLASNNFKWSDNTVADKSVTWSIGKASGSVTLSKQSVTIQGTGTDTVTVSNATGTVTVSTGDSSVATVSISDSTITITGVGVGTTTITVSVADTANYAATTESISIVIIQEKNTWVTKSWSGYSSPSAFDIWTDGDNIYYSSYTPQQYKLNRSTSTWETKTWNGFDNIIGNSIWAEGNNIYYSNGADQYVLNKTTSTWESKSWSGLTNFYGSYVWTDGDNIYYSAYSSRQYIHYILDKSTSTWSIKTWNGYTNFTGDNIWTDGNNIYCSNGSSQYVLDISTSTWETKIWNNLTNFNVYDIWTDGYNVYYSNNGHYVLNKDTSTWNSKTWYGLTNFYATWIWNDGDNVYCSSYNTQYVLT